MITLFAMGTRDEVTLMVFFCVHLGIVIIRYRYAGKYVEWVA